MERLSTSAGSSGGGTSGNKKERHFWQYNVQAKGPKGQKIVIDTKMDDPHQLNDIVDPVFSGDVQLQGIKHRYPKICSFHEIKRKKDILHVFLQDSYFIHNLFSVERQDVEMEMTLPPIQENWQRLEKSWNN